jgi:hypothetical protein
LHQISIELDIGEEQITFKQGQNHTCARRYHNAASLPCRDDEEHISRTDSDLTALWWLLSLLLHYKIWTGCCGFPHTTSTYQASLLSLISTSLGCQEPSLVPHSLSRLGERQIRLATMALTRKKR